MTRKVSLVREDANAGNCAIHTAIVDRVSGNPAAFSAEENAQLQKILRGMFEYLKTHGKVRNQTDMGRLLGLSQQSTARLLGSRPAGFGRVTALRLAELAGFDSPETMLREDRGNKDVPVPEQWTTRDLAVRLARAVPYDEEAIQRVVGRFVDAQYRHQTTRWWMDRIKVAADELDAERLAPAPLSQMSGAAAPVQAPASKPSQKRRRA